MKDAPSMCGMRIIAVSGPVGVGKDSLVEMMGKLYFDSIGVPTCNLPIAFQLKKELKKQIRQKYNLDSFSENREDKKIFRDDLIDYAERKRSEQPNYWINKWFTSATLLNKQYVEQLGFSPVFFISDLRHAKRDRDDIDILKENHALTIYIEQYEDVFLQNKCVFPHRESEEENDLYLKQKSDLTFRWVKNNNYSEAFLSSKDKDLLAEKIIEKLRFWKILKK